MNPHTQASANQNLKFHPNKGIYLGIVIDFLSLFLYNILLQLYQLTKNIQLTTLDFSRPIDLSYIQNYEHGCALNRFCEIENICLSPWAVCITAVSLN